MALRSERRRGIRTNRSHCGPTLAGREAAAEQASSAGSPTSRHPAARPHRHDPRIRDGPAREISQSLSDQRVPFELLGGALPEGTPDGRRAGSSAAGLSGGGPVRAATRGRGRHPDGNLDLSTGADIDFFLIEDAPPMGSAPARRLTVGVSHVACHRPARRHWTPAPTLDGDAGRARRPPLGRHAARRPCGADRPTGGDCPSALGGCAAMSPPYDGRLRPGRSAANIVSRAWAASSEWDPLRSRTTKLLRPLGGGTPVSAGARPSRERSANAKDAHVRPGRCSSIPTFRDFTAFVRRGDGRRPVVGPRADRRRTRPAPARSGCGC